MAGGGYLGGSSILFASRPGLKHGARPITAEEKQRFKHVTVEVGKAMKLRRSLRRKNLQQRFELLSAIMQEASIDPRIDVRELDAELKRLRGLLGLRSAKAKKKRGPRKR